MSDSEFNIHLSHDEVLNGIVRYCSGFNVYQVLNSGTPSNLKSEFSFNQFEIIAAAGVKHSVSSNSGSFDKLKAFRETNKEWMFGHFAYDLKNEIEPLLFSEKENHAGFENMFFFVPQILIIYNNGILTIHSDHIADHQSICKTILSSAFQVEEPIKIDFHARVEKDDYLKTLEQLKDHIQKGNIYEVTYCREFYAETKMNPTGQFLNLMKLSPSPFAALYRNHDKYLMSASPERFLTKRGEKIISQPMKGTYPRHSDKIKDEELAMALFHDEKERAENVMIVDLVRNDLSRTALMSSVKVEELFGIYTFPGVHQMVSTVTSVMDPKYTAVDVIRNAFPMGSMTGAPKIRAMQIIEQYEKSYRGLFSGSVGYFTPEDDFDFNVIIRSFLYNSSTGYLSASAGGAITSNSIPEKEFQETELKLANIKKLF